MLLHSWTRRKRFEARILANEVARLFAPPQSAPRGGSKGAGWVSPDEMLGILGVNL